MQRYLMKKSLIVLLVLILLASFLLSGCTSSTVEDDGDERVIKKAALVLLGNIGDRGWNQAAYDGLVNLEEKFGIETTYFENTPNSDFEDIYISLAENGYDLIIGHGFAFGDPALKVAEDYPNTKWLINSSTVANGKNVGSLICSPIEEGFLQGVVAGLATKTNHIGTVGLEIPSIQENLTALEAGAKYINPNVRVERITIADRFDAIAAKEAAFAHYEAGADIVVQNADPAGTGVVEAAEELNKVAGTAIFDRTDEDVVLLSGIENYKIGMEKIVSMMNDNTWEAKFYLLGIKDGASDIAVNKKLAEKLLTEEDFALIDRVKNEIVNGDIVIKDVIKELTGVEIYR
jgi:basic membrane protein A